MDLVSHFGLLRRKTGRACFDVRRNGDHASRIRIRFCTVNTKISRLSRTCSLPFSGTLCRELGQSGLGVAGSDPSRCAGIPESGASGRSVRLWQQIAATDSEVTHRRQFGKKAWRRSDRRRSGDVEKRRIECRPRAVEEPVQLRSADADVGHGLWNSETFQVINAFGCVAMRAAADLHPPANSTPMRNPLYTSVVC